MVEEGITYSRFSDDEQANGTSIERQQEVMEADAEALGIKLAETLVDDGYSASKGEHIKQGAFGKFLERVDKGLYRGKTLFAERQDRLSRLGNIETTLLFYRLLSAGVKIRLTEEHRTIKDINDLNELGGAVMTTVRACADQEFSQKLFKRISRAW
jgi:DNA invertase Pin-like site-specific DNA recombinase